MEFQMELRKSSQWLSNGIPNGIPKMPFNSDHLKSGAFWPNQIKMVFFIYKPKIPFKSDHLKSGTFWPSQI